MGAELAQAEAGVNKLTNDQIPVCKNKTKYNKNKQKTQNVIYINTLPQCWMETDTLSDKWQESWRGQSPSPQTKGEQVIVIWKEDSSLDWSRKCFNTRAKWIFLYEFSQFFECWSQIKKHFNTVYATILWI